MKALICWVNFGLAILIAGQAGVAEVEGGPTNFGTEGQSTVFIISMDGIRPDYIDRSETRFLDELMETGAWSKAMAPVFPTLTFATHVSLATGVKTDVHGVTGNSFYDSRLQQRFSYPGDSSLLEAEPIWTTAERQGVRTLVLDWVLAHQQTGPHTSAYFGEEYARGLSDEERISRVLEKWEADTAEDPLRLVMAYGESPDKEGHRYGPNAPELMETMKTVDQLLARVHEQVMELWQRRAGENDSLFFILVSDHGMSDVRYVANLANLAGLNPESEELFTLVTGGNVGHIFLDLIPADQLTSLIPGIMRNLSQYDFLRAFRREALPPEWGFKHPYRTGDIVVVLDNEHTWSRRPAEGRVPWAGDFGPRGMHGWDPATNSEMNTVFIAQRFPEPLNTGDLGAFSSLRVHATLAKLLEIEPAEAALNEPLELLVEE